MATIHIPALVQDVTGGRETVELAVPENGARTVRDILGELEGRFPGIKERLLEDGEIRPGLAVFIDGDQAGLGVSAKVRPDGVVFFLAPIVGGR